MAQIRGPRKVVTTGRGKWKGDVKVQFGEAMFPTLDFIFRQEFANNGELLTGQTNSVSKVVINSGPRGSGKSTFTDSFVYDLRENFGVENVGIQAGYDMFSMLGKWDEETASWVGGNVGDEFIQVIIIEDALTYLGKAVSDAEIAKVTKVFENARHRMNSRDDSDNKVGILYFIINIQGYTLLHDALRRFWDFLLLRGMPQNPFHLKDLRRNLPKEGLEILEIFRDKMKYNAVDQEFKGTCVVDFGDSVTYGSLTSLRSAISFSKKGGEYWVAPLSEDGFSQSPPQMINQTYRPLNTGEKEFKFTQIDQIPLDTDLLRRAFEYGRENPFSMNSKSKYRPEPHWEAAQLYLVEGYSTSIIAERFGVSDQMIVNGYNQSGYIACVIQEQIGYWLEPFVPEIVSTKVGNIVWQVIAGTGMSDLMDSDAANANGSPGIGIHGEIKVRRRKKPPSDKWISNQMAAHLRVGGKGYAYQIILRRSAQGDLDHKVIIYTVEANTSFEGESIAQAEVIEVDKSVATIDIRQASDQLIIRPKRRSGII